MFTFGLIAETKAALEESTGDGFAALAGSPWFLFALVSGVGIWLMLPRGGARGRVLGSLLCVAALGWCGWQLPHLSHWLSQSFFSVLAVVTVFACAGTVTTRNPLYSAIWFGLALLAIAALFFFQGSEFLGVATVTVYAGAILVTFLFVLMLAQPKGQAFYDRLSWEAHFSALAGAVLVGLLAHSLSQSTGSLAEETIASPPPPGQSTTASDPQRTAETGVLADQHVANLGRVLVGKHLIAMQVAGVLMLVALVGAVAIIAQGDVAATEGRRASPHKSLSADSLARFLGHGTTSHEASVEAPQEIPVSMKERHA